MCSCKSSFRTLAFGFGFFAEAVASGQQAPQPATLKALSIEELMNVEVTSVSKRPERLFEAASAIQVITREDIRRSGAASIPEALRLAPNLEVAQIDARQWAISARGFNSTTSNKLLVLIDGRNVYTPLYAGVFWDVQDTLLDDIDRIEVISGPGATVWGANAVNGVINIITKKAKDTQGFLLKGGGGTELRGLGAVRYGGHVRNLDFRFYGKYSDHNRSVTPVGADANDDWHTGQIGFRTEIQASRTDVVTLQGDIYSGRAMQMPARDIGLGGGNLMGRWERSLSENSDLKLQFYYDRTNRRVPATFAEGLDTFDLDLQHRFGLGERHDVVWGVAYRLIEDDIVNYPALAFLPPHVSRQWFSAFAQNEFAIVKDRLHATFGIKIEHNDYTGFELQPTARLIWRINTQQSLWGAISRAVRTPSRIDREFFVPDRPPFLLSGNSNFIAENVIAYELGYRTQLPRRFSLSLASYYNDYDHLRSLERLSPAQPAPLPVVIGNGVRGKSYGAELAVDYQLREGLRLGAGYSPLKMRFSRKPGSTDPNPGVSEAHDPDHRFLFRGSVDLPGRLEFDPTFRYVSRIANQNLPGYVELDSRLGWRPTPRLDLSLVGRNLLHRRHAEFGAIASRREIERSVGLKAVWSF